MDDDERGAHGGTIGHGGAVMTAVADAPARHRPPRGAGAVTLTAARLLRIELRRSAMPWILPVIAALFWFDSYRFGTGEPPYWVQRTFWNMGQGRTFTDFAPFVAGVAAWIGSRDDRRRTADLVAGAVRPRWAAQLAAWAAAAIWAVGAYLVFVGVTFAVYAHQGLQGSPPWWWVAVGAAAVTAFSAAGFAVGAFFPSRFAAPAAAFGAFLAVIASDHSGFGDTSGWPLILPNNANRADGLLAGHRVGAGRALDHAVDPACPAAARPRRGHLRRASVRRWDRGCHPPRRPRLRPPLRPRLSTRTLPERSIFALWDAVGDAYPNADMGIYTYYILAVTSAARWPARATPRRRPTTISPISSAARPAASAPGWPDPAPSVTSDRDRAGSRNAQLKRGCHVSSSSHGPGSSCGVLAEYGDSRGCLVEFGGDVAAGLQYPGRNIQQP